MITLIRLEADCKTLAELIADLDAAQKNLKLPKEMKVHDEHYEHVHDSCFKGRRVFRPGEKGASTSFVPAPAAAGLNNFLLNTTATNTR